MLATLSLESQEIFTGFAFSSSLVWSSKADLVCGIESQSGTWFWFFHNVQSSVPTGYPYTSSNCEHLYCPTLGFLNAAFLNAKACNLKSQEETFLTSYLFLPDSCKIMHVSLCPKLEFSVLLILYIAYTQKSLPRANDFGFPLPCITHISHISIPSVFHPYKLSGFSLFFSFSGYGCVASLEYLMSVTVLLMFSVLVSFLVAVIKFPETFY